MFEKFDDLQEKVAHLEGRLSDPSLMNDQKAYQKVAREHAHLLKLYALYSQYQQVKLDVESNKQLLQGDEDEEIQELAKAEIEELKEKESVLQNDIRLLLLPKDPNDERNTFLEIRAGTGGDEAALFVGDLYRMYSRFAESQGWKIEVMSSSPLGTGGFKDIIALISGEQVYSKMKYESGTHRVQRVPETETQGRIHTSAVTIAILPEADEVELDIKMNELKFDVFRSSGPGGQSVNTTDSAVRVTHLPTGLVVICQDEKSQHKNKAKAMNELRSRLYAVEHQKYLDEIGSKRKTMVSTGDRSAKIRTYNYPQGRITDHRINFTIYNLSAFMSGDIQGVIDQLIVAENSERLKESEL